MVKVIQTAAVDAVKEALSASRFLQFPYPEFRDMDRFWQLWHINGGVTHKKLVFGDTLFPWDDLGITHQFTISLFDQDVIYLGTITP